MPREVQSLYTDANVAARGGEREEGTLVVGPDRMDHGTDSWAWPDTAVHPDVLAAIAAIRGGLRTLPRERLAASPPSPDAVRRGPVARADLGGVAETLDGLSLLTLGERALAAYRTAVPAVLPPQAPASPQGRARRPGTGLVRGRRPGAAPAARRAERPATRRVLCQ